MEAIAVDWSGAATPTRAICLARATGGELTALEVGLSRQGVVDRLIEIAGSSRDKLVVGLDFAFSMPAWFLHRRGLGSAPQLWQLAATKGEAWLATCEPPFWGRPGTTRPVLAQHLRETESSMRSIGGIVPKSVFQIGGAGTVGTGSIRGMPMLLQLQRAGFAIWPFDPPGALVALEIWPRLLTGPVNKRSPAARAEHLRSMSGVRIARDMAEQAAESEDAFDAAVSALVMSTHADDLAALAPAADPVSLLEGRIWVPSTPHEEMAASRRAAPPGAAYSTTYEAALSYAADLHRSQWRKGGRIPYVAHLLSVSALVWESGGDEDQAIAALLHDAAEDQGGQETLEAIRLLFGERVADIVAACTDSFDLVKASWEGRKRAHLDRLETVGREALLVVAADKVHNGRSILSDLAHDGPVVWNRFSGARSGTIWYYRAMQQVLERRLGSTRLVVELTRICEQLEGHDVRS